MEGALFLGIGLFSWNFKTARRLAAGWGQPLAEIHFRPILKKSPLSIWTVGIIKTGSPGKTRTCDPVVTGYPDITIRPGLSLHPSATKIGGLGWRVYSLCTLRQES